MKRVAILGATSHVAKNLIEGMAPRHTLSLYARSPDKVEQFLKQERIDTGIDEIRPLTDFEGCATPYDGVVNCVGVGTPEKLRSEGANLFRLTEHHDDVILDYLARVPSAMCIHFSSGAVYGTDLPSPVDADAEFRIKLGAVSVSDAYRIAKLNSEAKHRACADRSIIDLRLFSFFSRHTDLASSYLLTEMVRAMKSGAPFATNDVDILRDYVHPADLCDLVERCLDAKGLNRALDVYARLPVRKSEILQAFQTRFGLQVDMGKQALSTSPTGLKSCYASNNHAATEMLGYRPRFSSLETLVEVTESLLRPPR